MLLLQTGTILNLCNIIISTGEPRPEISWYKNGKKVKPSKKDVRIQVEYDSSEQVSLLSISDATNDDAAVYSVKAKNTAGSVTQSVNVTVNDTQKEDSAKEQPAAAISDSDRPTETEESEMSTMDESDIESAPTTTPPVVLTKLQPVHVNEGESIVLKAKFQGTFVHIFLCVFLIFFYIYKIFCIYNL